MMTMIRTTTTTIRIQNDDDNDGSNDGDGGSRGGDDNVDDGEDDKDKDNNKKKNSNCIHHRCRHRRCLHRYRRHHHNEKVTRSRRMTTMVMVMTISSTTQKGENLDFKNLLAALLIVCGTPVRGATVQHEKYVGHTSASGCKGTGLLSTDKQDRKMTGFYLPNRT